MAPGVRSFIDIGGSQTEENSGAKAFGQAGQVYYTIEGVMGNNWTNAGGSGTFWDFQTIDEARVQSMATDPEFPTRGVQINAIVNLQSAQPWRVKTRHSAGKAAGESKPEGGTLWVARGGT